MSSSEPEPRSVAAQPSAVLQLGSSATLHCQVKDLPSSSAPRWRKPDGSLLPGSEVAELNPVARADEGAWNCTFSHDGLMYGKSLDIRVTGGSPTSAEHQQKSRSGSELLFHFQTLRRHLRNPSLPRRTRRRRLATTVRPLPVCLFVCLLFCPGCAPTVLSSSGGTISPPVLLRLSWWMWAVIAVGCLILIVLMAFIIYLCKRIQRKKVSGGVFTRSFLDLDEPQGLSRPLHRKKKGNLM